jgi:hypothetical protein
MRKAILANQIVLFFVSSLKSSVSGSGTGGDVLRLHFAAIAMASFGFNPDERVVRCAHGSYKILS